MELIFKKLELTWDFINRYFTSAQLNISIPGEDIVLHLGASGKLHRDISDHKTAGTVALNVSLLNPSKLNYSQRY